MFCLGLFLSTEFSAGLLHTLMIIPRHSLCFGKLQRVGFYQLSPGSHTLLSLFLPHLTGGESKSFFFVLPKHLEPDSILEVISLDCNYFVVCLSCYTVCFMKTRILSLLVFVLLGLESTVIILQVSNQ